MWIIGLFASSVVKFINDVFGRTTSGSLGTSTSGSIWKALRGTWYANGSQAQSDDVATNNSIASISFYPNATVSASVSGGTGIAYWVTDANNWYATVSYATSTPYTCGCSTCCYTCTHTGGSCGSTSTCNTCTVTDGALCGYTSVGGGCANGGYGPCYGGSVCTTNPDCTGTITGSWNNAGYVANTCTVTNCTSCGSTSTPSTCTNSDCSACGSYTCGCTTCYTNSYYMRLMKSVTGTVSTVISDVAVSSAIAALKVITLNGTITEYAYSDTAMTSQIGTATTTPIAPIIGTEVGIVKTSTPAAQGSTIDNFSATR